MNIRTWWADLRSAVLAWLAGKADVAARDSEQQFCWLLPGDVPYCPAPSRLDP
jgi:hypothetical protein